MSNHLADRLIKELIHSGRDAAQGEIEQIVERIVAAPFDARAASVRLDHRGLSYQGRTLEDRSESLFYHLVKRIVVEGQWANGTTAEQYVSDLHKSVLDPAVRLAVFHRRGGHIAVTVMLTERILPGERMGLGSLPTLLVIYSADRGMIISGYQVSGLSATGIPKEARWLK